MSGQVQVTSDGGLLWLGVPHNPRVLCLAGTDVRKLMADLQAADRAAFIAAGLECLRGSRNSGTDAAATTGEARMPTAAQ